MLGLAPAVVAFALRFRTTSNYSSFKDVRTLELWLSGCYSGHSSVLTTFFAEAMETKQPEWDGEHEVQSQSLPESDEEVSDESDESHEADETAAFEEWTHAAFEEWSQTSKPRLPSKKPEAETSHS